MSEALHYRVRPARPEAHLFEVQCTVAAPDPSGQAFSMAAWIPGSYMIRDFAKNVVRLSARCGETPVAVAKVDKQTWRCDPCQGPLTLTYEVYAWDLSVRSAHLDPTHAYFNGTSLFLRVHGAESQSCAVELLAPEGEAYAHWQVATTLPRLDAPEHGFGRYRAADYDELVDHPVEMGHFTLVRFEACGTPHEVAITGRHRTDTGRLAQDLRRICEHHIRFFGEPAPMSRYLFQVMAVGDGYGGLEHRASTSLMCKRDDLPAPGREALTEGYRTFLGLCSHEYFHTWNIKRIKPAAFVPYDLEREVHTPLLWAFEGITSYYDDLALVRCGLIPRESYLELLGQTITRVLRGSGRFKQSVAESSFDAWTKFYKQDENAPNAIVSYYAKGALIALVLDLTLRESTRGERSLDDVMLALWERHGKTGAGITEASLATLISEMAGSDFEPQLKRWIWGTEDPPLAELLAKVGVEYHLRPAESATDQGGKPAKAENGAPRVVLGAKSTADPAGTRITSVREGGAAEAAGLAAGDLLLALDGIRVTQEGLDKLLSRYGAGESVTVHAFRRDELLVLPLRLQAPPEDTCYLTLAGARDEAMEARLGAWLGAGAT